MSGQGIWDKLQSVDRRVFYWILFIGLTVPFLTPLGLPISVSPPVQSYYDGLKSIEPGEVVVLSINSGVSAWGDCLPAMVASVHMVHDEGGKLIVWSIGYNDCDITWAKIKEKNPTVFSKWKEGVDYVYFGYCPPQETNVALLRDNIRGVYTQDVRGVKTDDIPLMKCFEAFLGLLELEFSGNHRFGQDLLVLHPANRPEELTWEHGHISNDSQPTPQ
jgi:hypothetical protein